jgi:hypothetical protein
MSLRTNALVAALVLLAAGAASGRSHQTGREFPASAHLDDASVREAIALGEKHRPEPYLLYPRPGPRTATFAVYTPFIRVALAAYSANQRGERLLISKLPPWILESDVHVVVRPQSTVMAAVLFPEDPSLTRTPITMIVLAAPDREPPILDGIAPKWMTTDLSYLDAIGGAPFADAVAVAAFDAELVVQSVGVYGFWRKENDYIPSHGVIDRNVIRSWR